MLREIYEEKLTPDDQRDKTAEMVRSLPRPIRRLGCGPDQPGSIEAMRRAGLPAEPADNRVDEGIITVVGLLETGRLFFARPFTPKTVADLERYRWPTRSEKQAQPSNPLKRDDHGPDALRYGLRTALAVEGSGSILDAMAAGERLVTKESW